MRIKNWDRFQHFKDRRPPWIKLYRDLLDDAEWADLSPCNAKLLVMLWLLASEEKGELPDIKTIAFRLRITEKLIKSIVSELDHWLIHDDIVLISKLRQDGLSETETETDVNPARATSLVDSDWITELGKNAAYRHINLAVEIGKMEAWLGLARNQHRKKNRSFVLNWLNKIEAPMSNGLNNTLACPHHPDLIFVEAKELKSHNFRYHPKWEG